MRQLQVISEQPLRFFINVDKTFLTYSEGIAPRALSTIWLRGNLLLDHSSERHCMTQGSPICRSTFSDGGRSVRALNSGSRQGSLFDDDAL